MAVVSSIRGRALPTAANILRARAGVPVRKTAKAAFTAAAVTMPGSFHGCISQMQLPASCAVPRYFGSVRSMASKAGRHGTLHIGIVGYGLVGKELVGQVLASAPALQAEMGSRVELTGAARSSSMVLPNDGLKQSEWPKDLEVPTDFAKFTQHLLAAAAASGGRALIVDNTAADEIAELYAGWLSSGIHVVTPNKRAGSGPYSRYQDIKAAALQGNSRFMYEATVGAGLPIIAPLQTLVNAGDKVKVVQGIFSGTLSYIFNTWKPGQPFSAVVAEAKDNGFTEPDPRDDLSGTDVQRKVVILARELGMKLELDDVPVESLVPESLRDWTPPAGVKVGDAFVEEIKAFDGEMAALLDSANAAGEVLRFVGIIDVPAGKASVKLGRFAKDHPFASTQFADNIVTLDSNWYQPRPLVVQGPGAGAAVTAAGVYGNIMEAVRSL